MKAETRSVKTLQKALLSHAKAARWILASLGNKGGKPEIFGIRVSRNEVVVILEPAGVLTNPTYATLRGYKPPSRKKYLAKSQADVANALASRPDVKDPSKIILEESKA